jgi:IclR family transcriptional regulator, KDG regulon repressor
MAQVETAAVSSATVRPSRAVRLDTLPVGRYCLNNETEFRIVDRSLTSPSPRSATAPGPLTSVDKAFDVCEVLSREPGGMSLSDLARALKQPRPSVHRLLGVLKRRGYVRQDEETQHYSLSVKWLDLSFRSLGRSELRLHAYHVLRDYAAQSGAHVFLAVPADGEVTYIWRPEAGEVAMRTVYGKEMPAHCSLYFTGDRGRASRRLSCLRLNEPRDVARGGETVRHLGFETDAARPADPGTERLCCTCAPVFDYTGREVARVGVFVHEPDDRSLVGVHNRGAWELARHLSLRLGYLSAVTMGVA